MHELSLKDNGFSPSLFDCDLYFLAYELAISEKEVLLFLTKLEQEFDFFSNLSHKTDSE